MTTANASIKATLEARLRSLEQTVDELEAKIADSTEELVREKHRLAIIQEYYNLEFRQNSHESLLLDVPKRFEGVTVRQACLELLREHGAMHVAEITERLKSGGREVAKTSVTSVLIRGNEFQRVPGKPNTFRVKEE